MEAKIIPQQILLGVVLGILIVGGIIYFGENRNKDNGVESKSPASNDIIRTYEALSPTGKRLYYEQSEELTKPVPQRLVELDEKTIGCYGAARIMQMAPTDANLGGQCCGTLKNIEAYEIQLKALQNFIAKHGNIDLIPTDPYDVPVALAQKLIAFDQEIVLSPEQQQIYDEAMKMSHHGGPCCCKCWKWYVMSGLGKKLIVDHGFTAEELAELWDTSSSCGHEEDVNIHQHYHA